MNDKCFTSMMMTVWRTGGKIIRTVSCCVVNDSCTECHEQFLKLSVGLRLRLVFVGFFGFNILCLFCFSLDCFVLMLFAFVVFDLVPSVLRREIGWEEERLWNDLFCVEWDVKPQLNQRSISNRIAITTAHCPWPFWSGEVTRSRGHTIVYITNEHAAWDKRWDMVTVWGQIQWYHPTDSYQLGGG